MKGVYSTPGDYIHFKSQVPLHKISIGSRNWRYYDFGPKMVPPLICIPGIVGTADVYYKQIMLLSMKGYRVISIDIPRVWNHHEWIQAFEKFLDAVDVHHVHLYGTALGGFLAQLFAQHRPRRVRSLIISNSFLDSSSFSAAMPWAPIVSWAPSFLLKRHVLTGIRDGPHEPFIADSVDFVVSQTLNFMNLVSHYPHMENELVETLKRDDLASRLSLNADAVSVGPLILSDSFITIMDTNDYCAIPQNLKDQLTERYPGARQAYLKTGGDFPFLSRPDEVNLHLQLHMRRVGVEARPDLVRGPQRKVMMDLQVEKIMKEKILMALPRMMEALQALKIPLVPMAENQALLPKDLLFHIQQILAPLHKIPLLQMGQNIRIWITHSLTFLSSSSRVLSVWFLSSWLLQLWGSSRPL